MASLVARSASRAACGLRAVAAAPYAIRFAHSGTLKERETAAEAVYFNQEEERLLKKLWQKAKTSSDPAKVSKEAAELEKIVGKYKISDTDKKALLAWRHSDEF